MKMENPGSKETHSAKTIGILLAGGKSSRMGRNKALLHYNGVRLVDFMRELLNSVVDHVIISGTLEGMESIPDRFPELGPLGGISSVLEKTTCKNILVVPVDMPLLTKDLLNRLIVDKEKCAVMFKGHELPLFLKNSTELKNILVDILASLKEKRSIQSLICRIKTATIELSKDEEKLFLNINYPKDLEGI